MLILNYKSLQKEKQFIPLSEPHFKGKEWEYVKDCLDSGWVSSAGQYVSRFENAMIDYVGAAYATACMNGTVGLQIGLLTLDVNANHHVIAPNATFVASTNSVVYTGAEPILIDANIDDWQMDLDLLEDFLEKECVTDNDRTIFKKTEKQIKAIVIVHVYGLICDMDRLMDLANKYHIHVLEDASESLGAKFNGRHAGTIGHIGVYSFNGNKIITTGGGGMIVSNNKEYIDRAKHLVTQAKVYPQQYYHDEVGYNYRMVNVLAAIGLAQMEQMEDYLQKKISTARFYQQALSDVPDLQFQKLPPKVEANYWMVGLRTPHKAQLVAAFEANRIGYGNFWVPMHRLPMFKQLHYVNREDCSTKIAEHCICLPSSVGITEKDLNTICEVMKNCFAALRIE